MKTMTWIADASGALRWVRRPQYRLEVTKGPDRGRAAQSASARFVIGSGASADLCLTDPTVSGMHCALVLDAAGIHIEDLGSKNGTYLGAHAVSRAALLEKDVLTLGATVLKFEVLSEEEDSVLPAATAFGELEGSSPVMRELYATLERAAASDAAVLIEGETGTGKELAADAIHARSARHARPIVLVECGALSPQLAESELFGHEAGAFTGADRTRVGAFERAHGGTLVFSSVGDLSLEIQGKLLGVLSRGSIQRVGSTSRRPVDVRIISTTHRELAREVNQGRFREDLYYRLAVLQVRMPPLRERREDIPGLVGHFLTRMNAANPLGPKVLNELLDRDYPGNVRELKNAVERAALGLEALDPGPTPKGAEAKVDLETPFALQKERLIAEFERRYLIRLLEVCDGNVAEAARRAGLNRTHVYAVLRRIEDRDAGAAGSRE